MTFAVAWLAFPVVLGLVCFGCGLLLEEVTRRRLPVLLLMPMGFAFVIVLVQLATISDATAELGVPAAVAAAAAGFGLSYPWGRIDPWAVLAPLLAYAVYAAPVVLSGDPTFTGYIKLDDTATWFALTDRVMEHGRSLERARAVLLRGHARLQSGRRLSDRGLPPARAWAAPWWGRTWPGCSSPTSPSPRRCCASALYVLAGTVLRSGPARMVAAVVAASPRCCSGTSLWGGIKEIVGSGADRAAGRLWSRLRLPRRKGQRDRDLVLIAVTCAAVIAVLSASGGVWLLGMLLPARVIVLRRRGTLAPRFAAVPWSRSRRCVLSAPLFAAGGVVPPTSSPVTSDTAKGNLVEPLSRAAALRRLAGGRLPLRAGRHARHVRPRGSGGAGGTASVSCWPGGGGRPGCCCSWAARSRRAPRSSRSARRGSTRRRSRPPRPVMVFAALVGAGLLAAGGQAGRGRRAWPCWSAAGVLWSNVLAYHEVNLAPHDRHEELEQIGDRIAGEGPALMTEYEPYGVRHFLRKADAEGASELRRRVGPAALRAGRCASSARPTSTSSSWPGSASTARWSCAAHRSQAGRHRSIGCCRAAGSTTCGSWPRACEDSLLEHMPLGGTGDAGGATGAARQVRALGRRARGAGRAACRRTRAAGSAGRSGRGRPGRDGPDPTGPGHAWGGVSRQGARASTPTVTVRRPGRH